MRKHIMWLAPHSISIWLDLRTPNLLQPKTLNTKSRQGTGTLTSPAAETGQHTSHPCFQLNKDQVSGHSRLPHPDWIHNSGALGKRCSSRSGPILSSFAPRLSSSRGKISPHFKIWMGPKLRPSTPVAGQLNLDQDFIWRAAVIRTNQMPPAT